MQATASEKLPTGSDWIYEIKYDGWRAPSEILGEDIKLYSRNGISLLKKFPQIHEALKKINLPVVLDGEIVVLDKSGKAAFQDLQNFGNSPRGKVVHYYVFDCLWMDNRDLKGLPLVSRKQALKWLLDGSDSCIKYVDHDENGIKLFEYAKKHGLEGIMAKRASSKYVLSRNDNDRSRNWLKIKNKKREEFVIVGMLEGKGSRQYFGGLILAEKEGKTFFYRGHVGSGFSDKQLKQTYEMLIHDAIAKPVIVAPKFKNAVTWLEPKYYCQVEFTELTEEEVLRHPVFLGIRVDKHV